MFDNVTYPSALSDAAIRNLQRHGYPWGALLRLAFEDRLQVEEADPYYQRIKGNSRKSLKGSFFQVSEEAKKAVKALNVAQSSVSLSYTGASGLNGRKAFLHAEALRRITHFNSPPNRESKYV